MTACPPPSCAPGLPPRLVAPPGPPIPPQGGRAPSPSLPPSAHAERAAAGRPRRRPRRRSLAAGQAVLFGRQRLHLFRFDPQAVRVNPRGQALGEKFTLGAWRCLVCRVDGEMAAYWADCDCCPGLTVPVPPDAMLGGAG